MKKYWILIDTYVFVWKDMQNILFYNTLAKKGFTIQLSPIIEPVINRLLEKSNLRVTDIDASFYTTKEGDSFISQLRESFCGDVLDQAFFPNKPIVILPELNINETVDRPEETISNIEGFGSQISRNLMEATIQLTGACNLECTNCNLSSKQMLWCNKQTHTLSVSDLTLIVNKLKHVGIYKINFIGGDVLAYPHWDKLMQLLKEASIKKCVYVHHAHIQKQKELLCTLKEEQFEITVLADSHLYASDKSIDATYNYICSIASIDEYQAAQELIDTNNLEATILPLYTNNNLSFFEDYIYQTEDDILESPWSQKEIFAHQIMNTNYFGKFYFAANGEVYADTNAAAIGTIQDDFSALVHNEMSSGTSWRKTRDREKSCNACLYKYLCPSPSGYETAIGKSNLCHVQCIDKTDSLKDS